MAKKIKTLPKLKNELQKIFNSYIRLRDKDQPCISCNETKPYLQAGHFYPTQGYDGLRFDVFNVHGECPGCNGFDSAHLINYAENLLIRIGKAEFDALKARAKEYKTGGYKWHRSGLLEMIDKYSQEIKELK